jgi:short-subunit dehydrogenase
VLAFALVIQWLHAVDVESYYRGKRVVITGASRGVGKGLALRLSQLGAKLVITARTESDLKAVEKECAQNTRVVSVVGSVAEEEDCEKITNATIEAFGGVDILILNAAYSPYPTLFTEITKPAAKFLNVFKVNTLQSVYLTSMFMEELEKSAGIVVGVSSVAGLLGTPKITPYATSKHALHGFYSSLHSELIMQNSNVTVTLMPLPFVRTATAVNNMRPYSESLGLTVEDCANRMLEGIPLRHFFHYITWDTFAVGYLNSLCPYFFNWIGRVVMLSWFENM